MNSPSERALTDPCIVCWRVGSLGPLADREWDNTVESERVIPILGVETNRVGASIYSKSSRERNAL